MSCPLTTFAGGPLTGVAGMAAIATVTAAAAASPPTPTPSQAVRFREVRPSRIRAWSWRRLRSITSWAGSSGFSSTYTVCRSFIMCLRSEDGVQLLARTVEPGADRAGGDAERRGHLLVAELAECHEQQHVPFP